MSDYNVLAAARQGAAQDSIRILVCSDGSPQADVAVRLGARIAGANGSEVTLLGTAESESDTNRLTESLDVHRTLFEAAGVSPETVLRTGEPGREITGLTEQRPFDLVVIGAKPGAKGRLAASAGVYKVIKAVNPPVLMVIGDRAEIRRILICSGGERYIDTAVGLTGVIARAVGASVTLFHVVAEPPAVYADLIKMEEDVNLLLHSNSALGENLRLEKELLDQMGVRCDVRLRHGLVLSEVFKEIARGDYDLVVTGSTPDRGTLRRYLLGNLTREILSRADRSVLVVRPGEGPPGISDSIRGLLSVFGGPKSNR